MGNCSTYRERYYFDVVDKTCKKFYYTGCNGNRNNFRTLEECHGICSKKLVPMKTVHYKDPEAVAEQLSTLPKQSLNNVKSPEVLTPDLKDNEEKQTNKCDFECALNCPFGYRLNYRTNCPICECSMLEMTVSEPS